MVVFPRRQLKNVEKATPFDELPTVVFATIRLNIEYHEIACYIRKFMLNK